MAARETGKAVVEPVVRAPRPRIDWTARTRGSMLDAERYSRFVTWMKRALPLGAGIVVLAVVAYALVPRPTERGVSLTYGSIDRIKNDLAMMKPRLTGADERGNPFVITADIAIQDKKNAHRAKMKKLEADTTLQDGRWLSATAENGFIDSDTGKLALDGGIAVFTDSGYELHTSAMDVDLKKNFFSGTHTVTGQGPTGTLKADRFWIDRRKQLIQLSGNVHTTLYSSHASRK
ncbi:MAG TPA: LPS export ABC transporter periplasmic protein LptC [Rhizomicrobium sp.]|jgi:lipopolysaccharide export system protein LptC